MDLLTLHLVRLSWKSKPPKLFLPVGLISPSFSWAYDIPFFRSIWYGIHHALSQSIGNTRRPEYCWLHDCYRFVHGRQTVLKASHISSGILESMRSERKRKIENDAGYGILFKLSWIITNFFHRVTKKKRKTAKKVDEILMVVVHLWPLYVISQRYFQSIRVQSWKACTWRQIFSKGWNSVRLDFSPHFKIFQLSVLSVVMSDPKSRTGEQDKKNLMTLSVVQFTAPQT